MASTNLWNDYTDPMTGKSKRVTVVMDKNTAKNRKMAALTLSDKIESALAPQVTGSV